MTAVIVEMEEVAKAAAASGDTSLQGRALTALADAVLYQRADALGAQRLITQALDVLADESPEIRFEPLSIASQIAAWLGDNEAFERWAARAHAAQAAGRRIRKRSSRTLAIAYLHRLDFERPSHCRSSAWPSSPTEAGAPSVRGNARGAGHSTCTGATTPEATEAFSGSARAQRDRQRTARASMTLNLGRTAVAQGNLERGEKLLRDAERALKGLGGKASCEAQRALAQVSSSSSAGSRRRSGSRSSRVRPSGPRIACRDRRRRSRSPRSAPRRAATPRQRRSSARRSKGSILRIPRRGAAGSRERARLLP